MTNQYSTPLAVTRDERTGWDRVVTYTDGRVRTMRNYYIPFPIDDPTKSYLEKTYQFGTALDPYWSAGYSGGTVQLVDDFREGNDRVAVYTDGSRYVSRGWYERNPAYSDYRLAPGSYSTAPITTYVAPILPPAPVVPPAPPVLPAPPSGLPTGAPETPPIGFPDDASQLYAPPSNMPSQAVGIPPSSVTLPPNLSASGVTYSGTFPADSYAIPSTGAPAPLVSPNLYQPLPGGTASGFTGPVSQDYTPGVPSLTTGLGNVTPGVPNVPSTGPAPGGGLSGLFGFFPTESKTNSTGAPRLLILLAITAYFLFK